MVCARPCHTHPRCLRDGGGEDPSLWPKTELMQTQQTLASLTSSTDSDRGWAPPVASTSLQRIPTASPLPPPQLCRPAVLYHLAPWAPARTRAHDPHRHRVAAAPPPDEMRGLLHVVQFPILTSACYAKHLSPRHPTSQPTDQLSRRYPTATRASRCARPPSSRSAL